MAQQFEKLTELTNKFRDALIQVIRDNQIEYPGLIDFPKGSCKDASKLLGRYLISKGYKSIKLIYGKKRVDRTHVWLEFGNIIIDITADQFPSKSKEPLVRYKTSEKHLGYIYDETGKIEIIFSVFYDKVIEQINKNDQR